MTRHSLNPARAALLAAVISLAAVPVASSQVEPHWTYSGHGGPDQWGKLSPAFSSCTLGRQQSPIDLPTAVPVSRSAASFIYAQSRLRAVNNGHTVQVNYDSGSAIEIDGARYDLLQFHFHSPSEHALGGRHETAEMHLVHRNSRGELAVVGIFLREGVANPAYDAVLQNLPPAAGDSISIPSVNLDAGLLLPKDRSYWSYTGSLTTPPCSEGISWLVMKTPVELSKVQIGQLTALVHGNARPLQPLGARALNGRQYRVGALFNRAPNQEDRDVEILKEGLARLGYVEGSNLVIEARFAEGNLDRLPGFAKELVALGVDVIAAYGGPPTRAARGASTSIPIVANLVADPVALGYAATLQRPGGNVTGITNHDPELAVLQLNILREVFPALERVAFLSDADIPGADSTGFVPIERSNIAAATTMKITPQVLKLRGPSPDFAGAFDAMTRQRAQALVVLEVPVPFGNRTRIAELAAARRMPTMFWGGASAAGGMMSYGTTFSDGYPLMPVVIDRILKGADPAATPFEVVTRRQFVVNLKVARELGVTIPDAVLKRADQVIR